MYLILKPIMSWNGKHVVGVKGVRMTQGKPALQKGEFAVKLVLNFDSTALEESVPVISLDASSSVSRGTPAPVSAQTVRA
jgi:hypothetical protein